MEQRMKSNGTRSMRRCIGRALAASVLTWSASVSAAADSYLCGDLANGYGPYDYRTIPAANRTIVERVHFTSKVEMLREGATSAVGGDIDYTLRAMPNHHRALMSLVRLGMKEKTDRPAGASYTIECYFDRANRLAPDDPTPYLIYAIYLHNKKRNAEMKQALDRAASLRSNPTNFEFDYNLGLLYFDAQEYDKSAAAAKRAYALGAPFPALKNKLKSVGKAVE